MHQNEYYEETEGLLYEAEMAEYQITSVSYWKLLLIPIENFKALFLGFLFLRFSKCCVQDKKKTKWDSDSIPSALSSVLLSLVREPKGIGQKNV